MSLWKTCGRNRTRNIIVIILTLLFAQTIYIVTIHTKIGRDQYIFDEKGNIIGGMEPKLPQPPKVFDDGNSGLPFDAVILSDLFGFRCKCDLGYRPEAIILIHSYPIDHERRRAIRNTWGSPEQCRRHGVVLRFVMCRPSTREQAQQLKTEMEQHRDMMIGNFSSTQPSQSTLQSFLAIRWIHEFCPPTPYFIQACDLTFMRLDKLADIMNSFSEGENAIVGLRVNSNHGIYDSERNLLLDALAVNRTHFPPYATLDAGFVMPLRMALRDYSETHLETNVIQFIDIYYGFVAEKYSWTVKHNDAFSQIELRGAEDSCILNSKFTALSPLYNINSTYDIWRNITNPDFANNCKSHETVDGDPQR